jgi:hypothetical protein
MAENYERGFLTIDGIRFPLEKAVLSRNADSAWDLEIVGSEHRCERLGNELCGPYLKIEGLQLGALLPGDLTLGPSEISDEWEPKELNRVNATYFTLHGEGFGVWSCRLLLHFTANHLWFLRLKGQTDYPVVVPGGYFDLQVESVIDVIP